MRATPSPPLAHDAALDVVRRRLAAASGGAGSLIVVRGASGSGKTHFLDAVRDESRKRGEVSAAATNYAAIRTPFGPVIDLVAQLRGVADLEAAPAAERALFESVAGSGEIAEAGADRRRLFAVLAGALERIARRRPLALAIDDAHWADPESIEFLHFLATRLATAREVVLAAIPDGDVYEEAEGLAASLLRFECSEEIRLAPLDARAARNFVTARLPSSMKMSGRTIDEICRLGEGNPLLLSDLVRSASHGGVIALPRALDHATRRSMRGLAGRSARAIEAAAVLGRSFELADLLHVAELDRTNAIDALREGRDAALLDEDATGPGRFLFRNELTRLSIYECIFASERVALHGRAAALFERHGRPAEVLAYQFARAERPGEAAAYAERAGDAALAIGAFGSARDRYLDLLNAGVATPETTARVDEHLSRAYDALGDFEGALRHLERAIAYHRAGRSFAKVAALECLLSAVAYRGGDVDGAARAAHRVLATAEAASEQRFDALVALATIDVFGGDVAEAGRYLDLAAAERGRTPTDAIRFEWVRAWLAFGADDGAGEAWREPADAALAMARSHAAPSALAFTAMNYAGMAREAGRPDLATPALDTAIDVADANGLMLASAYARCEVIDVRYFAGRLAEAYESIRDVVGLCVDSPIVRSAFAGAALPVLADLGLADRFESLCDPAILEAALATGEESRFVIVSAAFAYVEGVAGRIESARRLIDRAVREVTTVRYVAPPLLTFARFGDGAHAKRVCELFERGEQRRAHRVYRFLSEGIALRTRDDRASKSRLTEAVDAADRDGAPLLQAFGLELLGRRTEAVALYERCGARAHVDRLSTKRGELTKREREIAVLLRKGSSNRAIAEALVLSERTVENHVASIYAKSGVRTRVEFLTSPAGS